MIPSEFNSSRRIRAAARLASLASALTLLAACLPAPSTGEMAHSGRYAPAGAPPDSCWSRHTTPAVVETSTRQVLAEPAQQDASGRITRPARFRTETSQEIVTPRRTHWIEIPCPQMMTPAFIRTLQRALTVRGLYRGPVHGRMDRATRLAVQRYQTPLGLDSGTLSLVSARKLGLVAVAG